MEKLKIAKEIIKKYFNEANCGIFNNRNIANDIMTNVYSQNGLYIDICYDFKYLEIFGCTDREFAKLKQYYISLSSQNEK